ncbi:unnamed protein product [Owenia fusiformis]|uniref:Dienelactone hydrolase domain-containing protein n=1 Tax=Owenia fusiformis TaxID=6347 RepID=A0A8S4P8K6_OWEFU|nr:unnamed protein product [Owenia fusiformis]
MNALFRILLSSIFLVQLTHLANAKPKRNRWSFKVDLPMDILATQASLDELKEDIRSKLNDLEAVVNKRCEAKTMMEKEIVRFTSENPKADHMYGSLSGDLMKSTKGLIVIQENLGMTNEITDRALKIAKLGNLVTLAVDLYRGDIAQTHDEARELSGMLSYDGAMKDIEGAAMYLKSRGIKKVGITGFCFGGRITLSAAALINPDLISAAAPFYGIPDPEMCGCNISNIAVPVQAHFGMNDTSRSANPVEAEKLRILLENIGDKNEFFFYDNAGHAFNRVDGDRYNKDADELSLKRLVDFMNKHLM